MLSNGRWSTMKSWLWLGLGFCLNAVQGGCHRSVSALDPSTYSSLAALTEASTANRIGDGYDVLTGVDKNSCLDATKTTIRTYPLNRATDTLYLVSSRSELAEKLNLEVSANVSGTYNGVTPDISAKTAMLRETSLSSNSITAVAEYRYLKDEITIYDSVSILAEDKIALLKRDNLEFRRQCGDKFTRKIKTGASLFLIFSAEKIEQTNASKTEIETALKVGIGTLVNVGGGEKLSSEQKRIIANFRISTKCYSEGTSAHPCADNMLNTTGVSLDDNNSSILDRIKAAKMSLANDIDSGRNIIAVSDEKVPYEIPEEIADKNQFTVFFDTRDFAIKMKAWLKLEEQTTALCEAITSLADECSTANAKIGHEIDNCSAQPNLLAKRCRLPNPDEFAPILSANNAGSVTLYEHGGAAGRQLLLKFENIYTGYSSLRRDAIYNLNSADFGFDDITSCFSSINLKPQWRLILFEYAGGSGRQAIITAGQAYGDTPAWFNDKASSFRLERVTN